MKNNKYCLTGFILGLVSLGFYWLSIFIPLLAIIFSGIGLGTMDIKKEKGKALGKWGLWLGIIYVFAWLLMAIRRLILAY